MIQGTEGLDGGVTGGRDNETSASVVPNQGRSVLQFYGQDAQTGFIDGIQSDSYGLTTVDFIFRTQFYNEEENLISFESVSADLENGETETFHLTSVEGDIFYQVDLNLEKNYEGEISLTYFEANWNTTSLWEMKKAIEAGEIVQQVAGFSIGTESCKLVPVCKYINNPIKGKVLQCSNRIVCG